MDEKEELKAENIPESLKLINGSEYNADEVVREINAFQDNLYEYINLLHSQVYNARMGSNVSKLTELGTRNTLNSIINDKIKENPNAILGSNANRNQMLAAFDNVEQPKICYICNAKCLEGPHVEHVIRILLLYLLTGHLPVNDPIKQASLKFSHRTCNVKVKGNASLFIVSAYNNHVQISARDTTILSERYQYATESRKSKPRPKKLRKLKNVVNPLISEMPRLSKREVDVNLKKVSIHLARLFNPRGITSLQVANNLKTLIYTNKKNTVSEIYETVIRDAVNSLAKGIRKNKTTKKKKNDKTKKNKQRSKRA